MKKIAKILLLLFFANSCLDAQTDLNVLAEYERVAEWQTPKNEIDSILRIAFEGGSNKFMEIIYQNIKLEARHPDHWVQNYLVEIEVSREDINTNFRNTPLAPDKKNIEQAFLKTSSFWKNEKPIMIRLLIASDFNKKFNKSLSEAYFQINHFNMTSFSSCPQEAECSFESKSKLILRINNLHQAEEVEGVIYYAKILARRFPFEKEFTITLWNLRNPKTKINAKEDDIPKVETSDQRR
ncbi:MAG: hypothetical protein AB8G15_21825 [Saprospiraceae bacterium]